MVCSFIAFDPCRIVDMHDWYQSPLAFYFRFTALRAWSARASSNKSASRCSFVISHHICSLSISSVDRSGAYSAGYCERVKAVRAALLVFHECFDCAISHSSFVHRLVPYLGLEPDSLRHAIAAHRFPSCRTARHSAAAASPARHKEFPDTRGESAEVCVCEGRCHHATTCSCTYNKLKRLTVCVRRASWQERTYVRGGV